ncbi:MAG: aminotransferase class IV, partial [Nitrospirae bacterium]|nr:aminotransferase class IV [Nitrospirota bacterium]
MIKKTEKIWMDGRFVDWDDANVHVMTHTLHYGLGVFEGIRCYETKGGPAIFRLKEHVQRLFKSAHIFLLAIPYSEKEIEE